MNKTTLKLMTTLMLAMLFTAACVTVNIYFPAAKVEKTADEIVGETYKALEDGSGEEGQPEDTSSLILNMLAYFGPRQAHAADATSIGNATIRGLKNNLVKRSGQMAKFYKGGYVGIDKKGYLTVRGKGGLSAGEIAKMRRLINADNKDRRQLYKEVAKALQQPDNVGKVESIFAKKWRSEAPGGVWVQDDNGKWRMK